ncbi:CHAT domain-containing protein [Multifurca ochricompacta]|uniref:CHAT domain-containing protein n=1 Tax=Multifurca ochricompacta TaxID=376703 RepID=A0AAD4LXL0_9AGAM|nr:CHAT domain-containing protein [Multifurca ochricompacta]
MAQELSIMELDQMITSYQCALSWTPRSHPTYTACIHLLAKSQFIRYELSEQRGDLDKSIVHYTEAIFLPPSSRLYLNVVQVFFQLVLSLLHRSEKFKQPEDAKCAVEYLRYLRGLPLKTFEVPHEFATSSLVRALGIQVELEAGGTGDIEEMVILCQELLTCHSSADYSAGAIAIVALSGVIIEVFSQGKHVQPLDEVIQCLRDALKICPPDLHVVPLGLATALTIRFWKIYSNDDYEEAVTLLESIVGSSPLGDNPSEIRIQASAFATSLARMRADFFPNPEYLEEAISRCRTLLSSSSLENDLRHSLTHNMAFLAEMRFHNFGLTEALQESRSYTSEMVSLASSSSAHGTSQEQIDTVGAVRAACPMAVVEEKIQNLRKLISKSPPRSSERNAYLQRLVDWYRTKFSRTNDITDLEEGIKCGRVLLASTDTSHLSGLQSVLFLGYDLYAAFECSNKVVYLDESITVHRGVLKMQSAQPFYLSVIQQLFVSLFKRLELLGRIQDLDEVIELFPLGVNDHFAKVPDRFSFSCLWAFITRAARHPSVSVAYENAMSLMQSSLVSAPTLQIQHARLVAMRGLCDKMPLDYASYQIDMGQFTQAIETLERGRALLWSEMRGFRNSMDQLSGFNSPLATKLAAINQDLESLTMSVTPSGSIELSDGGSQLDDRMDPFGILVVKKQKLLEERDALVSQIQELPGFGDFLKTPSFETIRLAASHGPVIIINHNEWRSDILILFQDSSPSLIPTSNDFYQRANKLRDRLVVARKDGLDSDKYKRALRSVLEGLYKLVGEPVIDKLHTLGVPEQSRIWWCPTSVFCSLPLHAMGPIPSNDGVKRYFSDLYIPSYTPTLSALIESRKPSPNTLCQPSLLLVATPDESLPGAYGEMAVIQSFNSRVPVATLCGKNATPAGVVERLRHHGFAHFVCHGTLETGKPFDASFNLFDDERLTLLDIVRSRLPAGEFAFLAACHTAELTDESIADEGLHLTAAVQYCGFRSVVGTMWEMVDIDGRELAENFYKSMFSGNGEGVGYHLRSARALRDATRKMRRKKGMTLERWVNFVHYGA